MASLLSRLADTLARWASPPTLDAPLPREAREMADAPLDRAAERAARDYEERERYAALLPSTDYRTNPRPVQVPVAEREPTIDALRAGLLARGPRADALSAAVVRAAVRDI